MDGKTPGSVFRPAFMLVSGRTLGFVVSFAIPVVLVRIFSQTEFGTYKQLFLIYTTLYGIGQLGMAESLYYFLPSAPADRGGYVTNAVLVLALSGLACLGLLWINEKAVGRGFKNPQLVTYLPLIGTYLLLMLVTAVFEIVMITRKRHLFAFGAYALSDLVRSVLYLLPALLFRSLGALFLGALAFAAVRFGAVALYLRREFSEGLRFDATLMKKHLAYALPFALAVSIETLQNNLHMYVVSYHFDAATFAIYSVGCLQIPLVEFMMTSTSSVMMVKMGEDLRDNRNEEALDLWLDTTRKLTLLFAPLVGVLVVTANKLIVLLFTSNYAASAPLFMLWSLSMLFAAIMTDSVLRVHADTRFLVVLNLLRLAVVALAIVPLLSRFGLVGAVSVTLLATAVAKCAALARVTAILRCGFSHVLPWRNLLSILAIAAGAGLPCLLLESALQLPTLPGLLILGTLYALSYGLLLWFCGPLSAGERRTILQWLQVTGTWAGGNRRA
ncbi:MAG: lipopolysaccharide biosynthesis protein [Bacillota bacterium]